MFAPTPIPNPNTKTNSASTAQAPIPVENIEKITYLAKWLEDRAKKVEETKVDESAKGFKKQVEEAYKEGYLQALSDTAIVITNLIKTGNMK